VAKGSPEKKDEKGVAKWGDARVQLRGGHTWGTTVLKGERTILKEGGGKKRHWGGKNQFFLNYRKSKTTSYQPKQKENFEGG